MFKISPKNGLILGLLLLLGFLGNYFALPLFFGADFLFGSAFVLLILYLFGLSCGLTAAVVVNSYTYVLWGHPYGFIIFILEIMFVGYFLRDRQRNLLLLDGLYWLLIGVPLNGLIYYVVLNMGFTTTAFIILKQGVNGIFNALLVSLVINFIPFYRFLGRSKERRTVSIQETTFNLLVTLVLVPALLLTILQIKNEMKQIENSAVADLQMLSVNIQSHLVSWYRQHLNPIYNLAQYAEKSTCSSAEDLQHDTELVHKSFPDFLTLRVENVSGITIACSPPVNERGSTIGVSLADREWFKEVRAVLKPVLSGVYYGNRLSMSPTVIISTPVFKGDQFWGEANASLDLRQINSFLEPYIKEKDITITLIDSSSRVIASTVPDRTPMQLWDRNKKGIVSPVIAAVYRWSPDEKNLPSMTRWRKSYFVQENRIAPDIPWTLIIESPIALHQKRLYAIYVQDLSILSVLVITTLLLALALSRWIAKPMANLATFTSSLPEKITMQKVIDWPQSETTELDSLIGNFQSMTKALESSFQNIKDQANALNMTLNATADGILAVDVDGNIIFYNQQFSKLWQIPKCILDTADDNMLLDHVVDQLTDPDSFMREVKRLYNTNDNSFDVIQFKDGRIFERYSFPMQHGESLLNGRVWSFRNITERKKAEVEIQKKNTEMEQFIYTVSHDLRSPLVTVKTFMGYLEKDMSEGNHEQLSQDIQFIHGAADKMKLLLDELLELSRIDRVKTPPVRVSLMEVMTEALDALAGVISERKVDIHLPASDLMLFGDRTRLCQIWQNLIENAIKYSPVDRIPRIELGMQQIAGEIIFFVKDSGIGIDPQYSSKVFGIFEKLDPKSPGAGLGLSMVQRVIDNCGGRIWVESEGSGTGSCFLFTLPQVVIRSKTLFSL